MDLGLRLKELRKQKKLSQNDLAQRLGINRVTYSQYEMNRREPNSETLTKLADFFNVSVDHLLGRTNSSVDVDLGLQDARKAEDIFKELEMRLNDGEKIYYQGIEITKDNLPTIKTMLDAAIQIIKKD